MHGVLLFALGELSVKQEVKSFRHRLGERKGRDVIFASSRGDDLLDQVLRRETEFLEFEEFTDRARRSLGVFLREDHDRGGNSALGGLGLEKERLGERSGGMVGGIEGEFCLPFSSTFYGSVGDDIGMGDLELGETVKDGGVCDGHGVYMVSCGGESSRVLEKGTQHESVRAVEESKKEKQEKETLFVWLPNDTFWIRSLLRNRDKVSLTHSSPDHADSLDNSFPFTFFSSFFQGKKKNTTADMSSRPHTFLRLPRILPAPHRQPIARSLHTSIPQTRPNTATTSHGRIGSTSGYASGSGSGPSQSGSGKKPNRHADWYREIVPGTLLMALS